MPIDPTTGYFYPQLNNDISVGTYSSAEFLLRDSTPIHLSGAGRLFASGSGDRESVYYVRATTGETIDLLNVEGSIDIEVLDELTIDGVVTSSTNANSVQFSSSINFLNTSPNYHLNASNSDLIFSSSLNSIIAFSGNIDLKNNDLNNVNNIQFNLSPTHTHSEGSVHWDADDKTLHIDTEVNGVALQAGQEMFVRATNKVGSQINNGQVVHISGAQGQRPTIYLADNDDAFSIDHTLGVATHNISNNGTGYITTFGFVRDLDTTGTPYSETWGNGDILYVGGTAGSLTNIEPVSPKHRARVGYVIYSHATEGIIFINVDTGEHLSYLHDVLISSAQDNDVLQYDSTTSLWNNTPVDVIFSGSSFITSFRKITADRKLDDTDHIIQANTYSNDVEVMLPTAAGITGREYIIKRISSGSFTLKIAATGSEKIDAYNSHTVNDQYTSMTVVSNGENWIII